MPLLLLTLPAAVRAQDFHYTTHTNTIEITQYVGSRGGVVTIPSTIDGLPVTSIGVYAFSGCTNLTSLTITEGVTSIGDGAFSGCTLTSVTIPNTVTTIGQYAFSFCANLTSISIPDSVTSIGQDAFSSCTSLTSVMIGQSLTRIANQAFSDCSRLPNITIPKSVTGMGYKAFSGCTSLTNVAFMGNAPSLGSNQTGWFYLVNNAVIHYLPGTSGWGPTFAGLPTLPWALSNPLILNHDSSFGAQTNRFGFTISWATHASVVVEACTNLAHPIWSPVATNALTGGSAYFSDLQRTGSPAQFYRLRSP